MKVLFINTSEKSGGAAIAANRLMEALHRKGIDTEMVVMNKESNSPHVWTLHKALQKKWAFLFERIIIWCNNLFSTKNLFTVSIANTGLPITRLPVFQSADIIHLHWINQGILSLKEIQRIIQSNKVIVWTMHDMWECTAICHYAYNCDNFKTQCCNCHYLRFPRKNDLAAKTFNKKLKIFPNSKIYFVAVSSWLKEQATSSRLLKGCKISVIPNTLSLSEFKLLNRDNCRETLHLPKDKKIILFGAARVDNPIKGFTIILKSIDLIIKAQPQMRQELHMVIFGNIKDKRILQSILIPYSYVGPVNSSEKLCQLYSSADVLVSASYYETFGQTLIESQACGCLPVSFGNSGQKDIIIHKKNGFLAEYLSEESLAEGIMWVLTEGCHIDKKELRENVIQKYDMGIVASQYIELYNTLLKQR